MVFELLVVAEGYVPRISPIDPRTGPTKLTLKAHDLDRRDPELVVRGRVVNGNGKPVSSAIIEPFSLRRADGSGGWGPNMGVDELAITDAKGEFRIGVKEKGSKLWLRVKARYFAPKNFGDLGVGATTHELRVEPGVTITGIVSKEGKALSGVAIGLIQQNRYYFEHIGHFKIATDNEGRFTFLNIPADQEYFIYGLMESCRPYGAIPIQGVKVGANGTTKDVGTVAVQAGHQLTGQLIFSDGQPIPQGIRVVLSRHDAWDSQTATVSKDRSFAFHELPAERYSLTVHVPGYHLSDKNASIDALNSFQLLGKVDADIKVRVLMEPGKYPPADSNKYSQENLKEYDRRSNQRLQGAPDEAEKDK